MVTQVNGDTGVSQCQPNSVSQDDLQSGVAGKGPAFHATISVGGQSIPSGGSPTVVQLAAEGFDLGGCFNNTGSPVTLNGLSVPAYSFCPNVPGYYQFSASTCLVGASGIIVAQINKNAGSLLAGTTKLDPSATNPVVSGLVFLNGVGDYITLVCYQTSGGALPIVGNPALTFFTGALVRAA